MKLLSDAAEYALRAVVWMAQQPGRSGKVREIAEGTKAAPGYLVKALQMLARAGVLSAQRGRQGGFRLEREPAELTVLEVINAVDPIERIRTCPLKLAQHGERLCAVHQRIDDAMAMIEQAFARSTIAELMREPESSRPRCGGLCTVSARGSACANGHARSDNDPSRYD